MGWKDGKVGSGRLDAKRKSKEEINGCSWLMFEKGARKKGVVGRRNKNGCGDP